MKKAALHRKVQAAYRRAEDATEHSVRQLRSRTGFGAHPGSGRPELQSLGRPYPLCRRE